MLLSLAEATCAYRGSNKREEAPVGADLEAPKDGQFGEDDEQLPCGNQA